jgi:hypothetical protein
MNAYGLRIAFGAQLAPTVFEIANQLFLLRINRDGRLSGFWNCLIFSLMFSN